MLWSLISSFWNDRDSQPIELVGTCRDFAFTIKYAAFNGRGTNRPFCAPGSRGRQVKCNASTGYVDGRRVKVTFNVCKHEWCDVLEDVECVIIYKTRGRGPKRSPGWLHWLLNRMLARFNSFPSALNLVFTNELDTIYQPEMLALLGVRGHGVLAFKSAIATVLVRSEWITSWKLYTGGFSVTKSFQTPIPWNIRPCVRRHRAGVKAMHLFLPG